ncbi:MAG: C39 family peptidase [Chloroflexota bacterium]
MIICLVVYYTTPFIQERLAWRLDSLRASLKYMINPPEQIVFIPTQTTPQPEFMITISLNSQTPTPKPTQSSQTEITTHVPQKTIPPSPSFTPTETPTSLPPAKYLVGIIHEYQKWNNCGPANVAMMLSFWGWQGTQKDTAAFLKPNPRDNSVMPDEIVHFVNEKTELRSFWRPGGDLSLLKRIIAAGYPILVEKGLDHGKDGWMGHYETLNGYDDNKAVFIAQDSFITPDLSVPYVQMERDWRAFNNIFIVIYPVEKEEEIIKLVGLSWNAENSFRNAAQKALVDTQNLYGRDLLFAWFNLGSNLTLLKDFSNAASAYDKYFMLYSQLSPDQRPWRMMWYQLGPYEAYYNTQRYNDVIALSTATLSMMNEKLHEETRYWRALSKEKIGDTKGAITDLQTAIQLNPNFKPAIEALSDLTNSATPQ